MQLSLGEGGAPTSVVKAIHPGLRVGLSTVDGADVVGLAKVVPGADLDEIVHVAVLEDAVPASRVEMGARVIDPLQPR